MSTSKGLEIKCISAFIVELINKTERQGTNDFTRQGRKKIFAVNFVSCIRPYKVGQKVNQSNNDGRKQQIT